MTKQEAYSRLPLYYRKLFLLITKQLIYMQRQYDVNMQIQTNSATDANLTEYTYDNNLFDSIEGKINYNTIYQNFTEQQFNTLLRLAEGRTELFELQDVRALFPNVLNNAVINLIMNFINNIVLRNVIREDIASGSLTTLTLFELCNNIYIENLSTHNFRDILNFNYRELNDLVAVNFMFICTDILTDANIREIYNKLRPRLT